MTTSRESPGKLAILVADDEPDIHAVTKLSLRGLRYRGRDVEILAAGSGAETIAAMRADPDIAVILLDVVMETDTAGLDACRVIRDQLGNRVVRILLRTGQPGQAPEKATIDGYDIDGYLAKAELSVTKLYSAVRAALKAWDELVQLERHKRYMALLHERAVALHSYDPLPVTILRVLETALEICPAPLGLFELQSFAAQGDPQSHFVHLATDAAEADAAAAAEELRARISRDPTARSIAAPQTIADGLLVPLRIHRELGSGWIYLAADDADELARTALTLLAGHAANALYSTIAEMMLAEAEDKTDTLAI